MAKNYSLDRGRSILVPDAVPLSGLVRCRISSASCRRETCDAPCSCQKRCGSAWEQRAENHRSLRPCLKDRASSFSLSISLCQRCCLETDRSHAPHQQCIAHAHNYVHARAAPPTYLRTLNFALWSLWIIPPLCRLVRQQRRKHFAWLIARRWSLRAAWWAFETLTRSWRRSGRAKESK